MTRRHRMKLWAYDLVESIAGQVLHGDAREAILGDLRMSTVADKLSQLIVATLKQIRTRMIRWVFPGRDDIDRMSVTDLYLAYRHSYIVVCRAMTAWFVAFFALASSSTRLLPDAGHIDFFGPVTAGIVLWRFLHDYRDGLTARPEKRLPAPATPQGMIDHLEAWLDVLCGEPGSLERVFPRFVAECFLFITLLIGPGYACYQGLIGRSLARGGTWFEVWARIAGAVLLFLLWIGIRRLNEKEARFLQSGIEVLSM